MSKTKFRTKNQIVKDLFEKSADLHDLTDFIPADLRPVLQFSFRSLRRLALEIESRKSPPN